MPLVTAFEAINLELRLGPKRTVGTRQSVLGYHDPLRIEESVAVADLPETGPGGDQRADLGDIAVGQEVRDHLAAGAMAGGHPLLEAVQGPRNHRDADPRVERGGEHRHPAAI